MASTPLHRALLGTLASMAAALPNHVQVGG
jgi:hypothetical protein